MPTKFTFSLVTPDEHREYYLQVDELVILPPHSLLTTPISHIWAVAVYATHYDPIRKSAVVTCRDTKVEPDLLEDYHQRIMAAGWSTY
ncbi:hypothetical protein LJ737_20005 [Hymenobacter sp. 15J16-1T3B]|uniref:hypothetical protein n=1 Tax=Hymenobacter sp. 15J16-1T3B TaxID=2886941 RepID=UPI001D115104|nr:hypothetical protein [Hymenobacter sp. 15J16-1T3B]MCC3159537.1 hypothetical protein [Hymenobacter sp. 15J16-1T3B]